MKIKSICTNCKNIFYRWPAAGKGKYCSRECYFKSGFLINNLKNAVYTIESRRKQSLALKGHKPWNLGRKGIPCHSEEWKSHLRERFKGENNPSKRPEVKEKIRLARSKQIFPIKQSSIETKIQGFLKDLGIEYFAHSNFNQIKHKYQCDIFIPSMNLVIECDGDYWHSYPTGTEIDHIRTKELIEKGFKVLRLWEREIKVMNLDIFRRRIFE